MTHATKVCIANGLQSILSFLCAFLTFSVLNGIFYLSIFFTNAHGVFEDGAFVRYENAIAVVTILFAMASGWVLAQIAPSKPIHHAWVFGGIITLYVLAISSQQSATLFDAFFAWAQIVPGMVCGAFLREQYRGRIRR